ncbi:HAD-like domain-containing protein [Pilaira anomala]|nr:HAD-like domain-containing protein [Pilaira anomala]
MGYDTVGLTVSREEAERLEAENARRLLKNRKLSLILDLDQTIVHASWDQRVSDYLDETNTEDIRQFKLPGSSETYYIKLRPGLDEFLKEIQELYELHIYTMGTRDYANAVANEIDPKGSIFKERILSRDESGSVTQKKLQRLFPCDTSMVVVLDDRSDVWSFSPNLIRIKPYEFFIGTGDINCPFKKILKNVHQEFYAKDEHDKEADVTHIIPKMKLQVLQHVIIAFTDVIPQMKDPSLSWIWQMATSFGATCSMDLTGKTTHLIAVKFGSKAKAAREYGHSIHIVTPAWLLDSTASWSIQDEDKYAIDETPASTPLELDDEEEEEDTFNSETEKVILDWDEANREVEDFINESGIDDIWDTDSDTKKLISIKKSPFVVENMRTRKRVKESNDKSGGESGGDGSEDDEVTNQFLAVRRRYHNPKKRVKSQLSQVTTASSSQCTSGNNSDDDLSSLDDLVGILDEAVK